MRVDFHVHTAFSPDSRVTPERLAELVTERGLDGVAVTDHDSVGGGLVLLALEPPFLVVVGTEVSSRDGDIIGLFVREDIEPGLTAEETVARIKVQGGVVVVPHPFDRFRSSAIGGPGLERISGEVDAVEAFNSRNLMSADDRRARDWALENGVPMVGGSDAHTESEVGRGWAELAGFGDAEGLKRALQGSAVGGRRSGPVVHVATKIEKRRG